MIVGASSSHFAPVLRFHSSWSFLSIGGLNKSLFGPPSVDADRSLPIFTTCLLSVRPVWISWSYPLAGCIGFYNLLGSSLCHNSVRVYFHPSPPLQIQELVAFSPRHLQAKQWSICSVGLNLAVVPAEWGCHFPPRIPAVLGSQGALLLQVRMSPAFTATASGSDKSIALQLMSTSVREFLEGSFVGVGQFAREN